MAKVERGLPKTFDIRVPEGPVKLGDYLDEAPAAAQTPPPPEPVAVPMPPPVISEPPVAEPAPRLSPPPRPLAPTPARLMPQHRAAPPRKQFNMAPDTLRMLDELLAHIRLYSAERDVRASELAHALVLAAYEVRPYLDLTEVPPRGKWGSPTAAALPVALKEAFQKAIAKSRAGKLSHSV